MESRTAEVATTSLRLSCEVARMVDESIRLPSFRLNRHNQTLQRMLPIRIITVTILASTASGCRIFSMEDFPSSKPRIKIRKAMIRPATYSERPCPKGWSLSAGLEAILNPSRVIMELPASDRLLKASATMETLALSNPTIPLPAKSNRLTRIPTIPLAIP